MEVRYADQTVPTDEDLEMIARAFGFVSAQTMATQLAAADAARGGTPAVPWADDPAWHRRRELWLAKTNAEIARTRLEQEIYEQTRGLAKAERRAVIDQVLADWDYGSERAA